MAGLSAPGKHRSRSRALSMPEIVAVYRATDHEDIPYPFGVIVRLLILTAQRRGEVAGIELKEFDKPAKLWTIPGVRTKNSREHPLPLGPVARRIVRTTPRLSERFMFPARGNEETTFSGWSKAKKELDKASGVTDWTLHDLRRSTATQLAALGVPPHIVERILNHSSGTFGGVAGVYNRFEYRDEMRAALRKWEKHLFAAIKAATPKKEEKKTEIEAKAAEALAPAL
jgi:integrase